MAKLRKGVSYRTIERPNTRISKFKAKSFVRMTPNIKIIRFDMGEPGKPYDYVLSLIPKSSIQIRQEALESARMTGLRILEGALGKSGYHFKIKTFPYHILRENPLASGAGADRMSTGMQKSFGKPIGVAAQVREGKPLFQISVNRENVQIAKKALHRSLTKLPCSFTIDILAKETITEA
ncbi:50S ribosomal protein L16 [Candidatus Woesearchaeota archaeon]|nr:50S ribosomal protein L16 [Candidatus Woesearchaeota archaeon]